VSRPPTHPPPRNQPRPTGDVQPPHDQARQAVAALADGRLADAERHTSAIPDTPIILHAWKTYLCGLLAMRRLDLSDAASLLLQAAALAFTEAMGNEGESGSESLRLSACALNHAGRVQRRQDRADLAEQTHWAAYHLRQQHGSWAELSETAMELGLDCDVAKRFGDGQQWYRAAIESAEQIGEASTQRERKAVGWTSLATSLSEGGQFQLAVDAARTASTLWQEHKPGSVDAARSKLRLGSALLGFAESLLDDDVTSAESALNEAVSRLKAAHDELAAFGEECASDVRSTNEQREVAEKLLATLGS